MKLLQAFTSTDVDSCRESFGAGGTGRSLFKFPFPAASHKRALDAMDVDGGTSVTPNISDTTRSLLTSCELLKDSAGDREGGRP